MRTLEHTGHSALGVQDDHSTYVGGSRQRNRQESTDDGGIHSSGAWQTFSNVAK